MRRFITFLTTIAFTLSGLVLSPATAATQNCGGGGTFTVIGNRITAVSVGCQGLVEIPEGVSELAAGVFFSQAITELEIPSTFSAPFLAHDLTSLWALTRISVSDLNQNYSSDNLGVLFDKEKTAVLFYPPGKTDSSYVIPWGVQNIEEEAFTDAQFTSVQIPGTVTRLGVSAFIRSRLTSVLIPASVTAIEFYAFRSNNSLSLVTFAGNPPGPANENYVFQGVTATARYSAAKNTEWTSKLAEYNRQTLGQANLTASSGNVYNFFNNGGLGIEPTPQWKPIGDSDANRWTAPTTTATRSGYTFAGWNTQQNGLGVAYSPGSTYANLGDLNLYAQWTPIPAAPSPASTVDSETQIVGCSSELTPLAIKKKHTAKSLAAKTCITTVSPKAKVSISVSKTSKKVCTKSGSKLKTVKAGNCVVTFTVQEPKPKKGKKPEATKTVKTLIIQ